MNTGSIHPSAQIRAFFAGISPRYDLANHLLSGGIDFLWRQRTVREVAKLKPEKILDLATGSGDLAILLARTCPESLVVGADFCAPMLQVARAKNAPPLVCADALHLPFTDGSFGAITIGFGLRNMASYPEALAEFLRVLEPGGSLLVLDFSLPRGVLGVFYRLYLHRVLPGIAKIVTGQSSAYEYLGESIEEFPEGEAMEKLFREAGFQSVKSHRLTGGIVTLYIGQKLQPNARLVSQPPET